MCGIFGIFNFEVNSSIDEDLAVSSLDTMSHRGPDAKGTKTFSGKCFLGHRRLSVIDLREESNQPFCIDNRYWIVYNGEIYNYLEIRNELIDKFAIEFATESDTEVLLRAYQYWGKECVNYFNGMWAFVIYDCVENNFFCSRDRFGVKPLNYAVINSQFIFASEIKAIIKYFPELKKPNYNVIANFCMSSVGAQLEETWFENIVRLLPAHNMLVTKEGVTKYLYWSYPTKTKHNISFDEAISEYKSLFIDSVKLRMRSDVPVGTTLSSGVDSNSIVFSLRQFNDGNHYTFTAAFNPEKFDALDKTAYKDKNLIIDEAAIVANTSKNLGLNQEFVKVDYSNLIKDLSRIIYHLESGNSSPAVIPSMQIMKKAREKVVVVLEGQGADELLGGYHQTLLINGLIEYLKSFKIKSFIKTIKKSRVNYSIFYALLLYIRQLSNKIKVISIIYQRISGLSSIYSDKLKITKKLRDYDSKNIPQFDNKFNKILYYQHKGGLVNLLHYGDAISMANSIETRLPFMDYRLVEFAFKLPWHFKFHEDYGKYIHRQAMKNICPDSILENNIKLGFNTPSSLLFNLKNDLEVKPKDILLSEKCLSRGLFNEYYLRKTFETHEKGIKNHSTLLYRLLCTELWFREFID